MEKFKAWVQKYCKRTYRTSGIITRDGIIKAMLLAGKRSRKQTIEEAAKWFEDNFKDWFEEEMMSNIIIEFKQAMKEEE